jgi:hypothetical protein
MKTPIRLTAAVLAALALSHIAPAFAAGPPTVTLQPSTTQIAVPLGQGGKTVALTVDVTGELDPDYVIVVCAYEEGLGSPIPFPPHPIADVGLGSTVENVWVNVGNPEVISAYYEPRPSAGTIALFECGTTYGPLVAETTLTAVHWNLGPGAAAGTVDPATKAASAQ